MLIYLKRHQFGGYPRMTSGERPDDRFRALQEADVSPVDYVHPHYGPLYPVSPPRPVASSRVPAPRYTLRVKRPQGGIGAVRCSTRSEATRLIARLPTGVEWTVEDTWMSKTETGIA